MLEHTKCNRTIGLCVVMLVLYTHPALCGVDLGRDAQAAEQAMVYRLRTLNPLDIRTTILDVTIEENLSAVFLGAQADRSRLISRCYNGFCVPCPGACPQYVESEATKRILQLEYRRGTPVHQLESRDPWAKTLNQRQKKSEVFILSHQHSGRKMYPGLTEFCSNDS